MIHFSLRGETPIFFILLVDHELSIWLIFDSLKK